MRPPGDPTMTLKEAEGHLPEARCVGSMRCTNARGLESKYCLSCQARLHLVSSRPGRFEESLGKMRNSYLESLRDPSLLDLKEPIAVIDLCAKRLMERVAEGDPPALRAKAKELAVAAYFMLRAEKHENALAKLFELKNLLERGMAEDASMNALVRAADRLARRIEAAWEIKLARKNVMNANEVVGLMGRVLDVLRSQLEASRYARIVQLIDVEVMHSAGTSALEEKFAPVDTQLISDGKDK